MKERIMMQTSLRGIAKKAKDQPKYRFRSLYRMIDLPMLYECYHELRRAAAPGVDGVDVARTCCQRCAKYP